tara:strand:+ start:119 stop:319 length:201 start_codon:yes stop_codon:yes gene_type:complete
MTKREHTIEYTKSKVTKGTVVYAPVPDEDDPEAPVAAKAIYFQKEFFDKSEKNHPEKMSITFSFTM